MPRSSRSPESEQEQTRLAVNILSKVLNRRNLADVLGQSFGGARDLYEVLGYKKTLKFADYLAEYDRGDVGARIIDAYPESTWRRKPRIQDDADPESTTKFEQAWIDLEERLRLFHYLERVDKLSGIGEYGVLVLGTADLRTEEDMAKPLAPRIRGGIKGLTYVTPYTQDSAEVKELDTDQRSPRFGRPLIYEVSVLDGSPDRVRTIDVHATRTIHIAEGLRENDILGTPRLQKCFNRLKDVEKVAGGSAEIFWQAAKRIMIMSAKEDFTAIDDDDDMTAQMEELVHGLRRVIDVQGYDVKTLDPTQVDPDQTFRVSIALISAATGIPQRILLGSEQGKLASEQDTSAWNGRVAERQMNFAEPVLVRPLVDILIEHGILPEPLGGGYKVVWPTLFEASDKEKAATGLVRARSLQTYVGKGGESLEASQKVMPLEEFRSQLLGLRPKHPGGETVEVDLPEADDNSEPDSSQGDDSIEGE